MQEDKLINGVRRTSANKGAVRVSSNNKQGRRIGRHKRFKEDEAVINLEGKTWKCNDKRSKMIKSNHDWLWQMSDYKLVNLHHLIFFKSQSFYKTKADQDRRDKSTKKRLKISTQNSSCQTAKSTSQQVSGTRKFVLCNSFYAESLSFKKMMMIFN